MSGTKVIIHNGDKMWESYATSQCASNSAFAAMRN